jgi:hypothetical protein
LNRLPFFAALLLAIAASAAPQHVTRPKVGQPPPPFTLRDQNRRSVSLGGAAGTKVVLVFYRGYW